MCIRDSIKSDPHFLDPFDVILNVGDADTAQTGGAYWCDEEIVTRVKAFVYKDVYKRQVPGSRGTAPRGYCANSSAKKSWPWRRRR